MLLSGIQKFSMLDFPGKTSCVVFTLWCNMRCSFCHNPDFVLPEWVKKQMWNLISEQAFFHFLESRKWLLEWVSICWGEPTLQKDLYSFCKKVKDMWFYVKLDTNGRDPEILQKLIEDNLLDYVAMDIKNPLGKFSEITWTQESENPYKESLATLLEGKIDYEFRTTVIKKFHSLENIIEIWKNIYWAKNYYLQNFRPGKTLDKNFEWEGFTEAELLHMKTRLQPYVKNIWIRT